MILINYKHLYEAEAFYEQKGFKRIEAPWWVPQGIVDITKPNGAEDYFLEKNKKCLVASGEQSLLYLSNQGLLLPGLYQVTTPCFRDEVQGPMRRKCFMKNELMIAEPKKLNQTYSLEWIIECSKSYFEKCLPSPHLLQVIATEQGFDLEYLGIELGSYGLRKTTFLEWIYGTGCAEPRLSWAIAKDIDQK